MKYSKEELKPREKEISKGRTIKIIKNSFFRERKINEKEEKAIKNIEDILKQENLISVTLYGVSIKDIQILLDLIKKQQKEIENSVSKSKIRNKIEYYKEYGKHIVPVCDGVTGEYEEEWEEYVMQDEIEALEELL